MGVIEVAIGYGREPGKFRVEVVRSAAGEAAADAGLDAGGLLAGRAQFQQTLLVSAVPTRQILRPAEQVVRDAGQALFAALLGTGEVAGRYRASAALADDRGEELRIVLRIDAPKLAGLAATALRASLADLVRAAWAFLSALRALALALRAVSRRRFCSWAGVRISHAAASSAVQPHSRSPATS